MIGNFGKIKSNAKLRYSDNKHTHSDKKSVYDNHLLKTQHFIVISLDTCTWISIRGLDVIKWYIINLGIYK